MDLLKTFTCVISLLALSKSSFLWGIEATYTIISKSGQKLIIEEPFYDGENLKAVRTSDGMPFTISPDALSPESWKKLNHDATANMRVSLRVKPVSFSRRDTEHHTLYGTYENTQISRQFHVSISSTSYFKKPTAVMCFWISGRDLKTEKHEVKLSRDQPYEFQTGGSASQSSLKGLEFPSNYRESKETDFVVVVEHESGSISEIYATQKGAKDLILEYYEKKDKR